MGTLSEEFEATLDRAERSLQNAREQYEEVSRTEAPPETIIQAIREVDQQIEDLSRVTNVTARRLTEANQAQTRAELLTDAVSAFHHRQRLLVERTVHRLRAWTDGFDHAGQQYELPKSIQAKIEKLEHYSQIFTRLLDAGEHANIVENKRVTPPELENSLRDVDLSLREELTPDAYAQVCLGVLDDLLELAHTGLKQLNSANPRKTSFGDYLREVKQRESTARDSLEAGRDQEAAKVARIALEGGLMVDVLVARAEADQQLAQKLGRCLRQYDSAADTDIEPLIDQAATKDLVDRIAAVIGTETEQTVEARIQNLLKESNGSVAMAVEQSDLEEETLLNHIMELFTNGTISDLTVTFDQQ